MKDFRRIDPAELTENAISLIGDDWMLITAEKAGKINMMTASWGGLGFLWGTPVAFVFIRPERYTFGFVEDGDTFTLSFFEEKYRDMLRMMGTKSGREVNKCAASGMMIDCSSPHSPFPEDARLVMKVRKLYADFLKEECFIDGAPMKYYEKDGLHKMYVCKIEEVLVRP